MTCPASCSPSPAGTLIQCEDRAHRIGQEHSSVNVKYLVARDTIDDRVWPMIERKLQVLSEAGLNSESMSDASVVRREQRTLDIMFGGSGASSDASGAPTSTATPGAASRKATVPEAKAVAESHVENPEVAHARPWDGLVLSSPAAVKKRKASRRPKAKRRSAAKAKPRSKPRGKPGSTMARSTADASPALASYVPDGFQDDVLSVGAAAVEAALRDSSTRHLRESDPFEIEGFVETHPPPRNGASTVASSFAALGSKRTASDTGQPEAKRSRRETDSPGSPPASSPASSLGSGVRTKRSSLARRRFQ